MNKEFLNPIYRATLAFFAIMLLFSCRKEGKQLVRIKPTSFNASDEDKIGRRVMTETWRNEELTFLVADNGAFTDEIFHYLRPLMRGLVEQGGVTRRDSFKWEIHIVLDDKKHAISLPGGQIILYSGLLKSISSEAECVGVLAREIALIEQGSAMKALDRVVENNVTLGDMIIGNIVPLDHIIEKIPDIAYTENELISADSLAALLVCPSNYDEEGLVQAMKYLKPDDPYLVHRPNKQNWEFLFRTKVNGCIGQDSLYSNRYVRKTKKYL